MATAALLAASFVCAAPEIASAQSRANAAFNWTGFYIGANGGYAWSDRTLKVDPNDPAATSFLGATRSFPGTSYTSQGGFGGLQVGYNHQATERWVVGVEGDVQFGSIKGDGSTSLRFNTAGLNPVVTHSEKVEWFSTVRGRIGYLLTPDALLYATGGLAMSTAKREGVHTQPDAIGTVVQVGPYAANCVAAVCFAGEQTKFRTGIAVGAGAEVRAVNNVTFKAEYLYVDSGTERMLITATPVPVGFAPAQYVISTRTDFHIVRFGLNYQFR